MTRELKLALIVGFALVLLVAVLISDHLSDARSARLADASDKPNAYITEPVTPPVAHPAGSVRTGPLASRDTTPDIIRDVKEPNPNLGSAWTTDPLAALRGTTGPVAVTPPAPAPATEERTLASHAPIPTPETDTGVPTITQSTRGTDETRVASSAPAPKEPSLEDRFRDLGYQIKNNVIEKAPVAASVESVTVSNPTTGLTTPPAPAPTRVIPVAPDSRTLAKAPAPATSPGAGRNVLKPEQDDATYYTIANGDSLYKIAKKFYGNGEEWRKIAEANKLSERANLKVGSKIKIPNVKPAAPLIDSILNAKSDSKPAVTPAPQKDAPKAKPSRPGETRLAAATSAKAEKPKAATYVVQSGDTLGEIAKKKLGSSKRAGEIIALNPDALSDPDDLYVGLSIRLPSR